MAATRKSKSLKNTFVDIMLTKIFSGELQPGDRLAPERQLAEELGLSRGSINQGMLDLERMGYIRIAPRKGSFVAQYKENATPETLGAIMRYDSTLIDAGLFKDLMDMRILIERECVRLACANIDARNLRRLSLAYNAIYTVSREMLPDAIYSFHRVITQISGNAAYELVFNSFERMIKNLIHAHYASDFELSKSLTMYDKLFNSICAMDAAKADELIHGILGQASEYLNVLLASKNRTDSQ